MLRHLEYKDFEIEKLVNLCEVYAEKIENLNKENSKRLQNTLILIIAMITFFFFQLDDILYILNKLTRIKALFLLLASGCLYVLLSFSLAKTLKVRRLIFSEKRMLKEILNLYYEYTEYSNINPMDRKLFDIRIKKIEYTLMRTNGII